MTTLADEIRELLEDKFNAGTNKPLVDSATSALLTLFKKHWLEMLPEMDKSNAHIYTEAFGCKDGWNKAIDEMRKKINKL